MAAELLVLTHEYPPTKGGIATYVAETVGAARAQGWSVIVLAPRDATPVDEDRLRVIPTEVKGTQDWPDRWRMRRAVKALELDWSRVTLWLPEPGPIRLWMYARRLGLPRPRELVLTFHGSEILRLASPAHRRLRLRRLVEQAGRVGVVSNHVGKRLATATASDAARFLRVPGAVGSELQGAIDAGQQGTPSGERFSVLTVGRVHPRKGQLDVVEAIGRMPEALRARIDYRLVGPVVRPAYLQEIRQRARALEVRIHGPDTLPDSTALARAYREADLFVLSSRELPRSIEGLGLVYLEAAAAGCPVIGADTGGAREAIGPNNGRIVPESDPDALARAMSEVLSEGELREAMGSAGPDWAGGFSWSSNAAQLFPRGEAAS